jgi:hypothetical protein
MGIGSFLFGKPAKSASGNQAYSFVSDTYSPVAQTGVGATNALAALLGLGGDEEEADEGFNRYLDSTGYDFTMDQGGRAITGSAAARGMLGSGSTAKALTKYGQDIGQQYYQNYLGQLSGLAGQGLNAGQLITGAGQQSTSSGGSKGAIGGIGKAIGGIASIFSDRRLKTDIEKISEDPDGLGWYRFRYIGGDTVHEGTMADEVAKLRPWALGPEIGGYSTVYYEAL